MPKGRRHKGAGESGTICPQAAIGNAVAAALPEIADQVTSTPILPQAPVVLAQRLSSRAGAKAPYAERQIEHVVRSTFEGVYP